MGVAAREDREMVRDVRRGEEQVDVVDADAGGWRPSRVWGRETAGRWVRDERVAEDKAVERVEKTRWRASRTARCCHWGWHVATFAMEQADGGAAGEG
jgi:hypothetical protein